MRQSLSLSFPATEIDARSGICTTLRRLRVLGIPETHLGSIEIALAEAVNNVVEHAYACSQNGKIEIFCRCYADEVFIHIWDSGQSLPGGQLPAGEAVVVSGPRHKLPEGGFGWCLIRGLASAVRYFRWNGQNRLTLRFRFDASGG